MVRLNTIIPCFKPDLPVASHTPRGTPSSSAIRELDRLMRIVTLMMSISVKSWAIISSIAFRKEVFMSAF